MLSEPALEALFAEAARAQQNAYAPYSHYKVGAALFSDQEGMFTGCNVENAAYPCGTCAEEAAIAAMVTAGHRRIRAIVIIGGPALISPCGACRQRLAEFCDENSVIACATEQGIKARFTLEQLLPASFSLDVDPA